jgi:ribonucleoside-diphosphate reductase alpha chain
MSEPPSIPSVSVRYAHDGSSVKPVSGGYAATPAVTMESPAMLLAERIKQARAKGYEVDPCSSCGQLTLVRSGACCKCDTCGDTSGCS